MTYYDFHEVNGDGESGIAVAILNKATLNMDVRMVKPEDMYAEWDIEGVDGKHLLRRLGYDERLCVWTELETMSVDVPDKALMIY